MTRSHDEAHTLATAGASIKTNLNGGGPRPMLEFVKRGNGNVAARLHDTDVVTWNADGTIIVATGGWETRSTFNAIAAALDISRARVGMVKRVPYVNGRDLSSGSVTFEKGEIR